MLSTVLDDTQEILLKSKKMAYNGLLSRKLDHSILDLFGVGYCASSFNLSKIIAQKHELDQAIASGIFHKNKQNELFCMFHQRITVPIRNHKGEIISFAGRKVKEKDESPKWVNGRSTELYQKGEMFYGLDIALERILSEKYVIICEGYFDVMAIHASGFKNVLGLCGTAFTGLRVHLLKVLGVKNVYLCLDSDDAGQEASNNAKVMLDRAEIENSIIRLDAHDASELLAKKGKNRLLTDLGSQINEFVV